MTYHMGIRLLELLIESTQLVEVKREHAGNVKLDGEFVHLTQAWADKLCSRAYSLAGVTPRYQPMIVPPKEWTQMVGVGKEPNKKMLHHVVYELIHGPVPSGVEIDHVDGNPSNNHPDNLRVCTHGENNQNKQFGLL
ncbi:HNH endonuclease signature motif containing protein [Pseudomonas sp. ANT_J28]|uniref:HNH endonuclease signature motif containing protein n=1 Tax=Pseudomonas sp. ANT_J28 TaxID=2597352 RepID=UPI0011F2D383|nr:HNH endonuclease signature motif containing protein [Pseudomonas sp. ANT_J28]KAA0974837.1 hypothetical protein FQ187_28525 [Pseudomonas sp. ANT_J28]